MLKEYDEYSDPAEHAGTGIGTEVFCINPAPADRLCVSRRREAPLGLFTANEDPTTDVD